MNLMKKIFSLLLLTALFQCAIAQTATFTIGNDSKEVCVKKTNISRTNWIGTNGNSVYLIQDLLRSPKGIFLTRYDEGLTPQARQELQESDERTFLGGFVNSDGVDLLILDQSKTQLKASVQRYDLQTLQPVGSPRVLKEFKFNDNDRHDFTIADSPDGELTAALYLVQTEGRGVEVQASLYDNTFEEYWQMDCPLRVMNDFFVTDSGEVLIGGYYTKKNDKKTYFELSYMDGDRQRLFQFDREMGDLRSMDIVRVSGDRIILTGIVQDPNKTSHKRLIASALYALTYNMKTQCIENFDKHEFTIREESLMAQMRSSEKEGKRSIEFLDFYAMTNDGEGTVVGYRQNYVTTSNGLPVCKNYNGIFLMRLDKNGSIAWTQVVRTLSMSKIFSNNICRPNMASVNGKTMIVLADYPSNKDPEHSKIQKVYTPCGSGASLNVVWIDRNGNIERQQFKLAGKPAIVGRPHRNGDSQYKLLLTSGSKSWIGTLDINR